MHVCRFAGLQQKCSLLVADKANTDSATSEILQEVCLAASVLSMRRFALLGQLHNKELRHAAAMPALCAVSRA